MKKAHHKYDIIDHIKNTIAPELLPQREGGRLLELADNTLRVFIDHNDRALTEIIRNDDGTLTWLVQGQPYRGPLLPSWNRWLDEETADRQIMIWRKLCAVYGVETVQRHILADGASAGSWHPLHEAIRDAAAAATGATYGNDTGRCQSRTNRVFKSAFVNPKQLRLTAQIFRQAARNYHGIKVGHFNCAVVNHDVFEQLQHTSPAVLDCYLESIFDPEAQVRRLSASGITRSVRNRLKLSGPAWALFRQLPRMSDSLVEWDQLPPMLELVAATNAPPNWLTAKRLTTLSRLGPQHQLAAEPEWPQLIRTFVTEQSVQHSITDAIEAMQWYQSNGRDWRTGAWADYEARVIEVKERRRRERLRRMEWDSLITAGHCNGYDFTSLTNALSLADLNEPDLNYSTPSDWYQATEGVTRLFTIVSTERPEAIAVGLLERNDGWETGHLTHNVKHSNRPMSQETQDYLHGLNGVLAEIARLYNAAEFAIQANEPVGARVA